MFQGAPNSETPTDFQEHHRCIFSTKQLDLNLIRRGHHAGLGGEAPAGRLEHIPAAETRLCHMGISTKVWPIYGSYIP